MEKARHFLIPCYDNIIEIIVWNIELEEENKIRKIEIVSFLSFLNI